MRGNKFAGFSNNEGSFNVLDMCTISEKSPTHLFSPCERVHQKFQ